MSPRKKVTLLIKDINLTFFVRTGLDDDRVLQLAALYEVGEDMDPIVITREHHELVDGRHRIAALELLDRQEVECELIEDASQEELIGKAFNANSGGALPPTTADIEHTVRLLLDRKAAVSRIIELLPFPPSLTRKYVKGVQDKLRRTQLNRAVVAVADGEMTAGEAAEQYRVDEGKLRAQIRGTKKKSKAGAAELNGHLTTIFRSHSQKLSKMMRGVVEKVGDGEMTAAQAKIVANHASKLVGQMTKSFNGWVKRLEVTTNSR